jgi:hypothetical protein
MLAIIAYMAGRQRVGYGSDLDIVFVYEGDENASEVYAILVRKPSIGDRQNLKAICLRSMIPHSATAALACW